MHWSEEYPHKLYASVLLLDNKIENWKVSDRPKEVLGFTHCWNWDRLNDYTGDIKEFEVNNGEEHEKVFTTLAPEWFKQWEHADDYKGFRAYWGVATFKGYGLSKGWYMPINWRMKWIFTLNLPNTPENPIKTF
jgi:hypothetical protein